jgi:predicted TIM-barrel fold metal-dependent hydrolase
MKKWFLGTLEAACSLVGDLPLIPQNFKHTALYIRNFVDEFQKSQMEIADDLKRREPNTVHCILAMDLRKGCGGVMEKSIDEQGQELIEIREKYKETTLIFWPVDPNQVDCYEKAIHALTALQFDGIKVYPSEGYLPSHPVLMKLWKYCADNDIPVVCHNSSANMHHPDWTYRIYGMIIQAGKWVNIDKIGQLKNEQEIAEVYNSPRNWIPVLEVYNNLRLQIAHFGGNSWDDYLSGKPNTKVHEVIYIITNLKYINTVGDVSFTFANPKYASGIRSLLINRPSVANKTVWGSDFHMVFTACDYDKTTKLFLDSLGVDLLEKICRINPKRFLNLT